MLSEARLILAEEFRRFTRRKAYIVITLAVPEYAFVESDGGLQQQYRKQRARLQETANLANELGRSQNLQSLAA